MRLAMVLGLALVGSAMSGAVAQACPDCPTSRAVAAVVCGDGLWWNLTALAAPFVVFAVVAWILNGIGAPDAPRSSPSRRPERTS